MKDIAEENKQLKEAIKKINRVVQLSNDIIQNQATKLVKIEESLKDEREGDYWKVLKLKKILGVKE